MWNVLAPAVGPIVDNLVDRIPDPNKRQEAKEEFEKQLLNAVNQASLAQTKINEIETEHKSIFIAGWRPFIGWVCGIGILWAFIVQPISVWTIQVWGDKAVWLNDKGDYILPIINSEGLFQLVLAMLGMGGLRTFEKMRGVARNNSPFSVKP